MSPLLSDDELKAISATPDGAAIAKKLQDMGDFIPKSRFDEVNNRMKEHADALAKIDAERKAADDERARKAGEFEKLDAGYKARIAELEKAHADEKRVADEFRAARQARVDTLKKEFGDDWLPEYESFSIASLDKIAAARVDRSNGKGKPDGGKPGVSYGGKSWAEMTPAERERMIQAVKSGEQVKV